VRLESERFDIVTFIQRKQFVDLCSGARLFCALNLIPLIATRSLQYPYLSPRGFGEADTIPNEYIDDNGWVSSK
jgi:hypothetical protein